MSSNLPAISAMIDTLALYPDRAESINGFHFFRVSFHNRSGTGGAHRVHVGKNGATWTLGMIDEEIVVPMGVLTFLMEATYTQPFSNGKTEYAVPFTMLGPATLREFLAQFKRVQMDGPKIYGVRMELLGAPTTNSH